MDNFDKINVKILSAISYIGPLFLVGKFSVEKDSSDYKFHSKQGKILFFVMSIILLLIILLDKIFSFFFSSVSVIFLLFYIGIFISWIMLMSFGIYGSLKDIKIRLPFIEFLLDKE